MAGEIIPKLNFLLSLSFTFTASQFSNNKINFERNKIHFFAVSIFVFDISRCYVNDSHSGMACEAKEKMESVTRFHYFRDCGWIKSSAENEFSFFRIISFARIYIPASKPKNKTFFLFLEIEKG